MEVINPHRFPVSAPPAVDFDGFGNASRYFDGVNDYIDLGDSLDSVFVGTGKKFTVTAWVKTNDVQGMIIGKDNYSLNLRQWNFQIVSSGKIRVTISNQDGSIQRRFDSVSTYATNNNWAHVAFTYDQTQADDDLVTLYANGSEVAHTITNTNGSGVQIYDTATSLAIGAFIQPSVNFPFEGNIADVRIYDTAITGTDMYDLSRGDDFRTNLVGQWLKDTPSLLDHSGTNDGTNVGSAFAYDNPSPAVEFGKASRVFDGVNDSIAVNPNASINNVFDGGGTFAAWVKIASDGGSNTGRIMDKRDNGSGWFVLTLNESGGGCDIRFNVDFSTVNYRIITTNSITLNAWHHIAVAYNSDSTSNVATVYIDGASVAVTQELTPSGTRVSDEVEPLILGNRDSLGREFDGKICDFRIYNSELSSTDITALYNGTHVETNLICHWLTNTDDVKDYAGSNDGTNNGSTYSFDNPLGSSEFGSASRSFDGTSNYITVPDGAWLPTGAQTWACWVKADTITGNHFLMSHYTGTSLQRSIVMHIQSNGSVKVNISPDGNTPNLVSVLTAANSITTGKWYHVAFEYLPSTHIKIFINGSQAAIETTNIPSSAHDSTDVFTMGASSAGSAFLNGNLADCRIYDTNLSAQDIFDISRGYDLRTNLVGQWLTNKDDVDDYAGSNNGTNTNTTYSQDAPL